ncbi:uncharacterized protein Dmul_38180 [Desulfococcus multivorans]|nr:uncharacterized protein Dmul_38180 [Desulfococcus multivorans]
MCAPINLVFSSKKKPCHRETPCDTVLWTIYRVVVAAGLLTCGSSDARTTVSISLIVNRYLNVPTLGRAFPILSDQ